MVSLVKIVNPNASYDPSVVLHGTKRIILQLVCLFQLLRTMQLSLSRLVPWSSALWPAAGGSGRIVLCKSCARTLRKSLSVQVNKFGCCQINLYN